MKIAVLGCGNMASAIVKSTYSQNRDIKFFTYTPSNHRAVELAKAVNGESFKNLEQLPLVDIIMIACKPQQFDDLSKELKPVLNKDQLVISVLAATELATIQSKLDVKNVTRIMPNTPCEINEGISLVYHAKCLSKDNMTKVNQFFSLCSKVIEVKDDKELDLLTLVAGSGPAYVFEFASSIANFLNEKGVDKDLSKLIVDQLFVGSSKLMQHSETDYDKLVDAVTSKAGVTIEAINTYREFKISDISSMALSNALKRSEQIALETRGK